MKTTLTLLSLVFAIRALAQPDHSIPRNVFQFSPQHLLIRTLQAGVEHFSATGKASYSITAYGRKDLSGRADEGYNGLGAEASIKKYVLPMRQLATRHQRFYHSGLYLGSLLYGMSFSGSQKYYPPLPRNSYPPYPSSSYTRYSLRGNNWGAGFMIGWQVALWERLFIDTYVGGAVQWANLTLVDNAGPYSMGAVLSSFSNTYVTDPAYNGITPKCGIKLGVGL